MNSLVSINLGRLTLEGDLVIPPRARGIVVFAHGSGSSRHSPRNRYVASLLGIKGLATLLMDLLTAEEELIDQRTRHLRFDIGKLSKRLQDTTDWLSQNSQTKNLKIGYFGASTGAAAALVAAANCSEQVKAIVSRGGRPDLAGEELIHVHAPTLLIVGERDPLVLELNQKAQSLLKAPSKLEIVPGATHLFPEPGALDQVAQLARQWFIHYLHHP